MEILVALLVQFTVQERDLEMQNKSLVVQEITVETFVAVIA